MESITTARLEELLRKERRLKEVEKELEDLKREKEERVNKLLKIQEQSRWYLREYEEQVKAEVRGIDGTREE